MMKKLFALLLAAVMLLGAGATALAAEPEGAGYVISIANSSTTNSLTVDLLTWEGMKNGRLELTYPEELTLVSARSTLDAGAGITDLDASKPGTVHFAWAAYTAQKDGTPVLRLTFRGQHGKTYFWNVIDTETGWQSKSMLPFDYRFNDVLDENAWYYDAVYAAWDAAPSSRWGPCRQWAGPGRSPSGPAWHPPPGRRPPGRCAWPRTPRGGRPRCPAGR